MIRQGQILVHNQIQTDYGSQVPELPLDSLRMPMKDDPIRDDRRPLYERAQSVMIARIMQGVYKPGDQLPPEDQLAAGFGVSRTTIRSALGNLETLGYIQRIHGAGTFVAQRRFQVEAQLDALESFHPRLAARRAIIADHAPGNPRTQADAEIAARWACGPAIL